MAGNNMDNLKKLRIGRRIKKLKTNNDNDTNTVIHIGERALVLKNEYKNINKVFSIKGLNTKVKTYIDIIGQRSKKRHINSKRWILADKLRTKILKISVVTVLVVLNVFLLLSGLSVRYKVYIDNKYIGELNGKNEFSDLLSQANSNMSKKINSEVAFSGKAEFRPVIALKSSKINQGAVLANLTDKSFFTKKGYAITANGEELVTVPTKAMAEQLLERLKEPYKKSDNMAVEFVENVEIKEKSIENLKLPTFDESLKKLLGGKEGSKAYKVQKGDTLWLIAKNNGVSVTKIKEINPGIDDNIREGQEIKLSIDVPLINIKTKEVTTLQKPIPFNVIEQKDEKSYSDSKKIISKGENGLKQSLVEIVRENGKVVSVDTITEKVVKLPISQKEKVGTKKLPLKTATGIFKRPIFGFITSRFGARWGRMHEGIDIAAKVGQPIYAADGGVVSFTGWEGDYGKLVKIRHGNSYVTYYGHCSKIIVKKGQKVYKGQKIALVGMTGRTTGPHLHFEIRKNGNPINPQKYL